MFTSVRLLILSSHFFQLLRVSEQNLETKAEYQDYMKSISAHVVETTLSGEVISHKDEQLVSVEAAGAVGSASRHALAVTELPGISEAHDGGDSHDLFGGMHPPPVHIRDKEELMAFASHLLDEMQEIVPDEPSAPASHMALHLVSMSSILVGSGMGQMPSMFSSGESALACGDRLRCLAEGFLISPHTQASPIRHSTMIRLAENALEEYERALASSNVLCRAHVAYQQGICLYILSRYLDALRSFNEALAGPQKARAWHAKVCIY
jgi:tetratricopeptide (TPR) repeat protein